MFSYFVCMVISLNMLSWGQQLDYNQLASHPRLILQDGDVQAIKGFYDRSANAKRVHDKILSDCKQLLVESPVVRKVTGRRLLSVSREALKRIFYLSF